MIHDLDKRISYWSNNYQVACQGPTEIDPFDHYRHLFVGKNVLEIGPGQGRQYETVRSVTKTYAIADIVPGVLEENIFKSVDDKYLIKDYSQDLGKRFNLIHCWYVAHHVMEEELGDFFSFILRHLEWGGTLMFNFPLYDIKNAARFINDGTKTVHHDDLYIRNMLSSSFALCSGFSNHSDTTLILQGKLNTVKDI